MDWIERLNSAIGYIEKHLSGEISYEEAAKIACCSVYHFQRMFTYMAGVPLSEYIRRRRMSLAAEDLLFGREKIIDTALKYGYASPTAFNRAFQSIHGFPPSKAKESGISVKTYPPIRFQMIVKGMEVMQYRIEKKEAFRIVGVSHPMDKEMENNFMVVPQMWQKVATDGTLPKLVSLMDSDPKGVLGLGICDDKEDWRYWIAVASTAPADGNLEETTVGAYTWAVFPGEGVCPQAIQDLEKRIFTEWLPSSGYEYDNGPDIELYLEPNPQQSKFEVWIPVVKK